MAKRTYRKAMEFIHKETKDRLIFAKWNGDIAACINKKTKMFVNVPRKEMDEDYLSVSGMEKESRERRKYQAW
ncbi:hypothetical protein ACFL2K_04620 [Candidatus Margulisiibacteriota bacterium]